MAVHGGSIDIGGKTYSIAMNMGALSRLAEVLEVETFSELQERLLKHRLADMPKVIQAVLEANGHNSVAMADIEQLEPMAYFQKFLPALFRRSEDSGEANGADHPPKSRAKKSQ